jgi:hypothetical protein
MHIHPIMPGPSPIEPVRKLQRSRKSKVVEENLALSEEAVRRVPAKKQRQDGEDAPGQYVPGKNLDILV